MGSSRLGREAGKLILADGAELFMSAASWWELGIKQAIGKLDSDLVAVRRGLEKRGVTSLAVTADHAEAAAKLRRVHSDPFDHMLVAQALHEGLTLLTRDARLTSYGPPVLSV